MKKTIKAFIEELNEIGAPPDELRSNGGRCPDSAQYGTWLHRADPIAFQVAYNEWER